LLPVLFDPAALFFPENLKMRRIAFLFCPESGGFFRTRSVFPEKGGAVRAENAEKTPADH